MEGRPLPRGITLQAVRFFETVDGPSRQELAGALLFSRWDSGGLWALVGVPEPQKELRELLFFIIAGANPTWRPPFAPKPVRENRRENRRTAEQAGYSGTTNWDYQLGLPARATSSGEAATCQPTTTTTHSRTATTSTRWRHFYVVAGGGSF